MMPRSYTLLLENTGQAEWRVSVWLYPHTACQTPCSSSGVSVEPFLFIHILAFVAVCRVLFAYPVRETEKRCLLFLCLFAVVSNVIDSVAASGVHVQCVERTSDKDTCVVLSQGATSTSPLLTTAPSPGFFRISNLSFGQPRVFRLLHFSSFLSGILLFQTELLKSLAEARREGDEKTREISVLCQTVEEQRKVYGQGRERGGGQRRAERASFTEGMLLAWSTLG